MIKNEELRERIDQFCEDLFIPKIPYGSIADINARTALTPIVGTEKEFRGKLTAFAESLAPPESPGPCCPKCGQFNMSQVCETPAQMRVTCYTEGCGFSDYCRGLTTETLEPRKETP